MLLSCEGTRHRILLIRRAERGLGLSRLEARTIKPSMCSSPSSSEPRWAALVFFVISEVLKSGEEGGVESMVLSGETAKETRGGFASFVGVEVDLSRIFMTDPRCGGIVCCFPCSDGLLSFYYQTNGSIAGLTSDLTALIIIQ